MLTITRKDGEAIQIGTALIYIEVIGNKAKVHIEAPRDVPISRGELLDLPKFSDHMRSRRAQNRAAG